MPTGKLIIVTGVPPIVRNIFSKNPPSFEAFPYFSNIINTTTGDADAVNIHYRELLELENERNKKINNLIKKYPIVVVEEWYLGNTAWAMAQQTSLIDTYRNDLERLIKEIGEDNLIVWFVSTDQEKWPPKYQSQYNLYLEKLTYLISNYKLHCDTIDGEETSNSIEKRVLFLLNSLQMN